MKSLAIIANARKVGTLFQNGNQLKFCYAASWQQDPSSFPLSVSMPLTQTAHPHDIVEAYLWGLLPDNQAILDQIGKRFQVSPRNVFSLLANIGEDCPGAIQIVPPEREDFLLNERYVESIEWLTEKALEELILSIKENQAIQRPADAKGHFSLAGAQPKTALYQCPTTGKWGIPAGQTPTTHILKPAVNAFAGFAENEHFCLQLANRLGLAVAESEVKQIADVPVIVVKRYDRYFDGTRFHRVHQEDFCQALGVLPHLKYQRDGGPSVKDMAAVIWESSSLAVEDIRHLAQSLTLNYLLAGTDAHAKNFSLLFGGCNHIQLSPLYDVISLLPYPDFNPHKTRLAMKVGSEYKLKKITNSHWGSCANELRLKPAELKDILHSQAKAIQDLTEEVVSTLTEEGLTHPIILELRQTVQQRCKALS